MESTSLTPQTSSTTKAVLVGLGLLAVVVVAAVIIYSVMSNEDAQPSRKPFLVIADEMPRGVAGTPRSEQLDQSWLITDKPVTIQPGDYLVYLSVGGFTDNGNAGQYTWTISYSTAAAPDTFIPLKDFNKYFNAVENHEQYCNAFVWTVAQPISVSKWRVNFNRYSNNLDTLTLMLIDL